MRFLLVPVCFLTLLTGCATMPAPRPLDTTGLSAVRNQTVAVTARKTPDFTAFTPGNAMFGAIGGLAAVTEGNRIVAAHHVEDPAVAIVRDLSGALHDAHGS